MSKTSPTIRRRNMKGISSSENTEPYVKVKDMCDRIYELSISEFIYGMNESLTELEDPNTDLENIEMLRQKLLEYYFACKFFTRKHGWDCKKLETYQQKVNRYLLEHSMNV